MNRGPYGLAVALFVAAMWGGALAASDLEIRMVRGFGATEVLQPDCRLEDVELAEAPIIAGKDIVSYDGQTHTMLIRRDCWVVLQSLLKIDFCHLVERPFVLLVGGERLYAGMFYNRASSRGLSRGQLGVDVSSLDTDGPWIELRFHGFDEEGDKSRAGKVRAALSEAGLLLGK